MTATVQDIVTGFIKLYEHLIADSSQTEDAIKKACSQHFYNCFKQQSLPKEFLGQDNKFSYAKARNAIITGVEQHYADTPEAIGKGCPAPKRFCESDLSLQSSTLTGAVTEGEQRDVVEKKLKLICTYSTSEGWKYNPQIATLSSMLAQADRYLLAKEDAKEASPEKKLRSLTIVADSKKEKKTIPTKEPVTSYFNLSTSQKAILTVSLIWLIVLTAYGLDSETAFAHCCDVFRDGAADDVTADFFELSENSDGKKVPNLEQNLAVGAILSSPAVLAIAGVGVAAAVRNRAKSSGG